MKPLEPLPAPLLLGHRGVRPPGLRLLRTRSTLPPENTLEAFEYCMGRGCDGFEFDVRFSRDRQAVVCHDPRFRGRTLDQSDCADLELCRLEQTLKTYSPHAFLDIEVKVPGGEEEVLRLVRAHSPRRGFVVSSFQADVVRTFAKLDPDLPLGHVFRKREEAERWRELPVNYVIPNIKLTSHRLIEDAHAHGKRVIAWTVNDAEQIRRLIEWKVDGIISDRLELLIKTAARYARRAEPAVTSASK